MEYRTHKTVNSADRWKAYSILEAEINIDDDELGHPISKSQFKIALKWLKNNKTPEIDGIQAERLHQKKQRNRKNIESIIVTLPKE